MTLNSIETVTKLRLTVSLSCSDQTQNPPSMHDEGNEQKTPVPTAPGTDSWTFSKTASR